MEKRRYSFKDLQRMTHLAPNTLQDLLDRYRQHFAIEVCQGKDGKHLIMDQLSVDRLLFIRQLELEEGLGREEAVKRVEEMAAKALPAVKSLVAGNIPNGNSAMNALLGLLDRLGKEIHGVQGNLENLLLRYSHVLRELNLCREENRKLRHEIDHMKQRQIALINQSDNEEEAEPEKKPSIN